MGNTTTKESRPGGSATSSSHPGGARAGSAAHSSTANASSKERRERREQKKKEAEGYQLIVDPKEMVDGGYLFPQGVYTGPQDFKCAVVRDLIIRRKLAPFYKGLETYSPDMTDDELLDAVGGKPKIGAGDASDNLDTATDVPAMPDHDLHDLYARPPHDKPAAQAAAQPLSASDGVTASPASSATHTADTAKTQETVDTVASDAPADGGDCAVADSPEPVERGPGADSVATITGGVQGIAIARSAAPPSSGEFGPKSMPRDLFASIPEHPHGGASASGPSGAPGGTSTGSRSARRRANTHSLGKSSKQLEKDAQTIWLYRNVHECPICFLLYPRLNNTRCCGQEICTECFVQIKRAAPHPPYTESPVNSPPPAGPSSGQPPSSELELVSEPACCPYCVLMNFGITFEAPPFEWGIPKPPPPRNSHSRTNSASAAADATASASVTTSAKPRRPSFAHTHSDVVTIDQIRPDWESKLASARRRLARKAAAARALHQSSLLPAGTSSSHSRRRSEASHPFSNGTGDRAGSRHRRRSTLGDFMQATRTMSAAQTRELENQMMEEAIRQSLREV